MASIEKQLSVANRITRFFENFKKTGQAKMTEGACKARIETLQSLWSRFDTDHWIINDDADVDVSDNYFKNDIYGQTEEMYLTNLGLFRDHLTNLSLARAAASTHAVTEAVESMNLQDGKLPIVTLPTFGGEIQEWARFRDTFTEMIVRKPNLAPVYKMHYLNQALSGEAAELLKEIPPSGDHFADAWKTIKEHYDNTRLLITKLIAKFMSIQPMSGSEPQEIGRVLTVTENILKALKTAGSPVEHWDHFTVFITTSRLSPSLQSKWEQVISRSENPQNPPKFVELIKFLKSERISSMQLESANQRQCLNSFNFGDSESDRINSKVAEKSKSNNLAQTGKNTSSCCLCKGKHNAQDCKNSKRCKQCSGKHHSLLHFDNNRKGDSPPIKDSVDFDKSNTSSAHHLSLGSSNVEPALNETNTRNTDSVLLATAWIQVQSVDGVRYLCRALIDQGAQSSFITERLCQSLNLKRKSVRVSITGIGGDKEHLCKSTVVLRVQPHFESNFSCNVKAYVIPKITTYKPLTDSSTEWQHLKSLTLADPNFGGSERIDVLLGAQVHAQIVEEGIKKGNCSAPIAMKTSLGWIVSGSTSTNLQNRHTISINVANADVELNKALRNFREVEEVPRKRYITADEQFCEELYEVTTKRNQEGKYGVRLPKKPDAPKNWGNSYSLAVNSLLSTERRFVNNTKLKGSYVDCMHDYITKGHLKLISNQSIDLDCCYFSPHHGIFKESSTTTQFRIVYNASKRSNIGLSANDCLYTGPNLLPEIIVILTRWRMYRVVFVADVEKMFRQIWVNEEDQHLQAIVWRDEADQEIQTYFLTTVTFGFASSPYLANRTIKQLSRDEESNYPLAAEVLRNEIYMDDVLSGGQNQQEAQEKQQQVIKMMASGGFNLRKWMSNEKSLIESLPQELRASAASLKIGSGFSVLGIAWDPDHDCFYFNIALEKLVGLETKRSVLAKIAKLYDPLGWIAPVIVALKIFMQSLWLLTREWDSRLPEEYESQWRELYSSLLPIANIRIKRWIGDSSSNPKYEFHGFADASKSAYAAVVYLRVLGETTQVFLLGAKTKVAPTKTLSIPRLELCAAQLVTKLTKHFVDTLQLTSPIHLWSDSRDVLYWLRDIPSKWPTFIANRCSDITTTLPDAYWHHINSSDNPADVASRGSSASDIINNSLWWNGPKRLSESSLDWSQVHDIEPRSDKRYNLLRSEQKTASILLASPKAQENWELLDKYSSMHKLLRVTSYLLRFVSSTIKNTSFKNRVSQRLQLAFVSSSNHLTAIELRNAELVWSQLTQSACYASQVRILQRGEELDKSDQLKSLNPTLRDGLLRVGGRLKNALLSEDEKFPIILLADHRFTDLVITQAHQQTLHGGTLLTLTYIRRRYWIIKARLKVKTLIYNCITCKRFQAKQESQKMGDLPAKRVQPARPFANSGVDYAGPYLLRTSRHRPGHKSFKGYFAVFICFSTKAVHLEAVSSYDTESFIAAFKRFIARRGPCFSLRSDQGTNFVGADAELRKIFKKGSDHTRTIQSALSKLGTTWSFNPPGAPHFGGIWEAAVKSVKRHLKRVVGDTILTFEEFSTILCQIEACLNSRPIIPLTDDASELFVLTPAHFLIGESSLLITEPDISDEKIGPMQRWKRTTQLVQRFWHHWSHEYLHQLQRRSKWKEQQPSFKVGDVVLLRHETTSPTRWPLAKVEEIFTGKDGLVRVVTVRTATTLLRRPIVKLIKLLDSSSTEE